MSKLNVCKLLPSYLTGLTFVDWALQISKYETLKLRDIPEDNDGHTNSNQRQSQDINLMWD